MAETLDTISYELFSQFEWFNQVFNNAVQAGAADFLEYGLNFKLVSVSKNQNALFQEDSYFVTKIKVDPINEVYIRCSDKSVNTILTRALGPSNHKFDINKITELEAKVVTGFNDNIFNAMVQGFNGSNQHGKKFDITHLTFILNDLETGLSGKYIVSFPSQLVVPQSIQCTEQKFSYDFFAKSLVEVDIKIGTTEFSVGDLKALEVEDIIVLDNSNIQTMRLNYYGYEKDFHITPNPALIMSIDSSGGEDMATNVSPENLWDSIQVEMGAEFDKVKISLGELKNIEQGLVVDIGSVYNNNITLKVENKSIAVGELVIVNDRYGVKINQIFAEPKPQQPTQPMQEEIPQQEYQGGEPMGEQMVGEQMVGEQMVGEPMEGMEQMPEQEGDFDYSDFELEDEDI